MDEKFYIEITESMNKVIQNVKAKKTQITKATVRALNKTASWAKTRVIGELSKKKQIKKKLVRNRVWIRKATRN